jgi:hypothetical protein
MCLIHTVSEAVTENQARNRNRRLVNIGAKPGYAQK